MTGPALYVVSHEDDDLLFLSPDLVHDIDAGRRVVTVFVTAGDAGLDSGYWSGRERGIESAYALMAGVDDDWTTGTLGARDLRLRTLVDRPDVSVVFMRLPDGFPLGSGSVRYGRQSLQRLLQGTIPQVSAVDGSSSYSLDDLVDTLTGLMDEIGPTDVHVQDHVGDFGDGDHSDHHAVAFIARAASEAHGSGHTLFGHLGYPVADRLPNVVGADLTRKSDAFDAYAVHDTEVSPGAFSGYLPRDYLVDVTPAVPDDGMENVAALASVTASSENAVTSQGAANVIDDSVLGYPFDHTHEWATIAGAVGAWVQLGWQDAVTLNRVVLFDRPNPDDQVVAGRLLFSDGSVVATGPLDNRGFRTDVPFPPRTVTSVRFVVDAVTASTANVGLAEFQAWGVVASPDL